MRMSAPPAGSELRIEPTATVQAAALAAWRERSASVVLLGRPLREWQDASRQSLGWPTDRPIVLTGHQAGIWHAGILAKWFLADAVAARIGATAAEIVVDQDTNDAASVAYPALEDGSLATAVLPCVPSRRAGATGTQPPVSVGAAQRPSVPEVAEALERIRAAVNDQAAAPTLAVQMHAANRSLLRRWMPAMPAAMATTLLATPIGEALLDRMVSDPARCAAAYDEALAADPRAARPLAANELPLWRLAGTLRLPVEADDRRGPLAPRAFLMTALARLALGDLFVHGTGAARYERVTERWIRAWLGVELAPMAVATATLRLPIEGYLAGRGDGPVRTAADLRRRLFDPDAALHAEGAVPSPTKRELLAAIETAPRRSPQRRARYRALLEHLATRREANAAALAGLRAEVDRSRSMATTAELVRSRTWPRPLHPAEAIDGLRHAVRTAIDG
jgi:hypothetical protein